MTNLKEIILLLLSILCLQPTSQTFALKQDTHKDINEFIGENTFDGFSLDLYLKYQLGFPEGKDEKLISKQIYRWLGEGGVYEDEPVFRSVNHFHNPLEPNIQETGFSGILGTDFFS